MQVRLVNKDDIQKELELAGWIAKVSTAASDKVSEEKVAKHCINSGHGTPTRSMRFVFEITGVSRVLSHEFVRHEIGLAKCQRSQRYVKEDGFAYTVPASIRGIDVPIQFEDGEIDLRVSLSFYDIQSIIKQWYTGALKFDGVKPEDARYVLTNATHTQLRVSFDWEALVNFCHKRCCKRAQWEIRECANLIAEEVNKVNEFLGEKLVPLCIERGYCVEENSCGMMPKKEEVLGVYKAAKRMGLR
jgi:thymidylate synthase (FAD)